MKRILICVRLGLLIAAPVFGRRRRPSKVYGDAFTAVPNFLKLPTGEYLGESVAVATNSKGHVFVYHRSANTRMFEFDAAGNFLKEIGAGFYGFEFAHSVRVDKDDNIWPSMKAPTWSIKFSPEEKC